MRPLTTMLPSGKGIALTVLISVCGAGALLAQQQAPQSTAPPAPTAATTASQTTQAPAQAQKSSAVSPAAARRDAWKCLTDGVAEKDFDRRAQAISALGTIGAGPDVVRLVESGLEDKSAAVRIMAATTLGVMKSRGSIPKLRMALDDSSSIVAFAAAQALWQMGDKSGKSIFIEVLEGDRKATPGTVQTGLNYAHEELHDPTALAELGAQETAGAFLGPLGLGVAVVAEMAKDKGAPARTISARLLGNGADADARDTLVQALEDKSWIVRATAAEALGANGTNREINSLASLLNDDHREVRYEAAASIMRITARR